MVGLQKVGQIHSCKKTIIPIIPSVCDRLTPLIGTPCMKSIYQLMNEKKKNGKIKHGKSEKRYPSVIIFPPVDLHGFGDFPTTAGSAPHETLQGH